MRLQKRKLFRHIVHRLPLLIVSILLLSTIVLSHNNQYVTHCSPVQSCTTYPIKLSGDQCGSGPGSVVTSIDFGCQGKGNPVDDLLFSIIRFLSAGVGVVVVASVIVGGYGAS